VTELTRQVLEEIASSSTDGILVIDASTPDLSVIYVNPAFELLTGYGATEVVGHRWRMLEPSDEESAQLTALRAALGHAQSHETLLPDVRKDGTSWLSRIRVRPITNRRGELRQFLVMQADASVATETQHGLEVGLLQRELRRARQKAANLDRLDFASGLLRYEFFLEAADRDFRIARREQRQIALAVFQINDLDIYRQTFGTKAADSCLRMIAAQVTGALRRASDLCGCDEQQRIVALSLGQEPAELERVVDRIARNVRHLGLHNPRAPSGRYVTVSTTVAATVPGAADRLTALIDRALAELDDTNIAPCDVRQSASV